MATYDEKRRLQIETQAATALLTSIREIVHDDEEARVDAVEGETSLLEAIDAAVDEIDQCEAMQEAIKTRVKHLNARAERFENKAARLKLAIIAAMQAIELKKLQRPSATLSLPKTRDRLVIVDESAIPSEWQKEQPVEFKLDKAGLLAALKEGAKIPGTDIGQTDQTVSIRRI